MLDFEADLAVSGPSLTAYPEQAVVGELLGSSSKSA